MLELALNVITTASVFFTVSVGLLIVLSIMGVVNLAHGAFLTIGGYAAVVVSQNGWNPWFSLPLAAVVGFILGLIMELIVARRLYGRPLDTILATWGLAIIVTQILSDQFGRSAQFVDEIVSGEPFQIADMFVSPYKIFTIGVALVLGVGLTLVVRYTNVGIIARAVIMNPALARTLGINTNCVNSITFALGSALAAFAGAVIVPMSSVDPHMGTPWVVTAFMVVLAAGISLPALLLSAVGLAAAQVLATYFLAPVVGSLLVIAFPILLLRLFPDGISTFLRSR
ncbi:branched-chain amino acid ABC transporter permease [Mesorhizobium sp. VK23B]|uniref:Branched-chain amino acid ABC transporter permease n=1 Tax=Mesorhizobium dulcispinae TaxID=3072316 RepID=A0ABU4XPW1_9HYPH|nr:MULTISPECIES: branched-chain amino acid ABC transporter permease [unclassified Mesorhizobium]MDX8469724.1 branched-chain amino acid ABC transporter permease [Mesorhizobium sp. VK23B]MDX8476063.1 branched-chain amino acid ABC transporter permease [Mesorhizobium sp. VK23A]